jgi:hypothetical protein
LTLTGKELLENKKQLKMDTRMRIGKQAVVYVLLLLFTINISAQTSKTKTSTSKKTTQQKTVPKKKPTTTPDKSWYVSYELTVKGEGSSPGKACGKRGLCLGEAK